MKKRMLIFSVLIVFIITSCVGRLSYIFFSNSYAVADTYNSYTLLLDRADVNLYYSDNSKITNNKFQLVAVIRPVESDIKECMRLFKDNELKEILNELSQRHPVIKEIDDSFSSSVINTYYIRKSEYGCRQMILKQCSGILMHLSKSDSKLELNFSVDANGRFLSGDRGKLNNKDYYSNSGIKLTLNKEMQKIAETAASSLNSGCIVVMNVKDSSILACVTKPDSSVINKCVSRYAVGSVFKIVTAAAALEKGLNITYKCKGSIKIGDTVFNCHNGKVHGKQNLKEALANSCNCYFINLSTQLSSAVLYNTAKAFGFDSSTELCNGWTVKNGCIPTISNLTSKGEKALFSFGQGKLTATPLQICNMMCIVANNGIKNTPVLVSGEYDGSFNFTEYKKEPPKRIISEETSDNLNQYLRFAVESGTGASSDYHNSVAGKTATAQTGQYVNGKEILNTWFAGYFPYEEPKYAVVVMCENGKSGAENCCPVFRTIVELINNV